MFVKKKQGAKEVSLVYEIKPFLVVKPLFYVSTSQECPVFFLFLFEKHFKLTSW